MKVKNLSEQRAELVEAAQSIIDGAKAAGRGLSDEDRAAVDAHLATIKDLDAKIAEKAKNERLMNEVGALFGSSDDPHTPAGEPHTGAKGATRRGYITPDAMTKAADNAARSLAGVGAQGVKALVGEGAQLLEVERVIDSPVTLGKPASTIWSLIPVKEVEPSYSYLRQVSRDNKAAPVAPGETKPTSTYGLQRIESRLRLYAHLSDPLHVMDLLDYDALLTFIKTEMQYGLFLAIEADALTGDGQGEHMTGLLNTSGVHVQAFNTDAVLSLRSAITTLEGNGATPDGIFLNPKAWEAIETSTYLLNDNAASPVDRAARRLWGLPVALSNAMPEGEAVVKSAGSVMLAMNQRGTQMSMGVVGDDFAKNQVRARLEARANLDVVQPQGIAKVHLANVA